MRRGALMKSLQIAAQTLPLYVSMPEGRAPPLCGAVPADSSYIARAGDIVAALVKMDGEEDSWILAEIVSYNSSTNRYEVDDIDETKDRHVLSKGRIVPLPLMRANPDTDEDALFPKGTLGKSDVLKQFFFLPFDSLFDYFIHFSTNFSHSSSYGIVSTNHLFL